MRDPKADAHAGGPSWELPETYIRQLMQSAPGPQVDVAWRGGEPMLRYPDFFRRSVKLANKYRQPHQRVLHTIQTNGTLIDEEWAAFSSREM